MVAVPSEFIVVSRITGDLSKLTCTGVLPQTLAVEALYQGSSLLQSVIWVRTVAVLRHGWRVEGAFPLQLGPACWILHFWVPERSILLVLGLGWDVIKLALSGGTSLVSVLRSGTTQGSAAVHADCLHWHCLEKGVPATWRPLPPVAVHTDCSKSCMSSVFPQAWETVSSTLKKVHFMLNEFRYLLPS